MNAKRLIFVYLFLNIILFNFNLNAQAPATYILQVDSNLSCQNIDVEVVSQEHGSVHQLSFKNQSFAAVEMAPGSYKFGKVTCRNPHKDNSYRLLENSLKAFTVEAGVSYFGGTLVFEESTHRMDDEIKMFSECPKVRSKARGASDNSCFGIPDNNNNHRLSEYKINAYAPGLSNEYIEKVKLTFSSASQQELVYLPLNT